MLSLSCEMHLDTICSACTCPKGFHVEQPRRTGDSNTNIFTDEFLDFRYHGILLGIQQGVQEWTSQVGLSTFSAVPMLITPSLSSNYQHPVVSGPTFPVTLTGFLSGSYGSSMISLNLSRRFGPDASSLPRRASVVLNTILGRRRKLGQQQIVFTNDGSRNDSHLRSQTKQRLQCSGDKRERLKAAGKKASR